MNKYLGEGALIIVTMIWGATFVIIKTALADISPMMFISLRFSIAALILLPFLFKILKNVPRAAIVCGFFLGLTYFLGFAAQTAGLKYTSATKSAFITGTFILFIPLFQFFFEKKAPGKGNLIGVLLVL
ncbi:MAG: DMT family transporter, partial [Ignavibacteriaceae bacterium]